MGETLIAARNDRVSWTAHITGALASSTIHWLVDGKELPALPPEPVGSAADQSTSWTSDGQRHWLRAQRTRDGTLQLLSNPIFVNSSEKP